MRPPPPSPCRARARMSATMSGASPQSAEPTMKTTRPLSSTRGAPITRAGRLPADAPYVRRHRGASADAVAGDEADAGALGGEGEARGPDGFHRGQQPGLLGGAGETIHVGQDALLLRPRRDHR